MIIKPWDELPEELRLPEIRPYYDALAAKRGGLAAKRALDVLLSSVMLAVLSVPMLGIAAAVKLDSPGTVFYRQERVTQYGRRFRIHKFRTMVSNADKIGSAVTVSNDARVTRVGKALRHVRLDELPQLLDVLAGDMSFVGTRPEVPKYVDRYTTEMRATLLMPAGITSEASIRYKDEDKLLDAAEDVDRVYVEQVLPGKMKYNLDSIRNFSLAGEITTMFRTLLAVTGKNYE
ncbi:MAG: sugar transferase [Oscillospiraceae bacterium]|nr:sugar transferase [Oscillospiraceae bacterium]